MSEKFSYKNPVDSDPTEQENLASLVCNWLNQAISSGERVISQDSETLLNRIQAGRAILAYTDQGQPVGCIFLHPLITDENGIEHNEPGSLYVIPEFRGRRLGVNLVSKLAAEFPDVWMYATIKVDHTKVQDHSLKSFDNPQNGFTEISFRDVNPLALVGLCLTAPCFRTHQNGHLSCANEALEHGGPCHVTVRPPILI